MRVVMHLLLIAVALFWAKNALSFQPGSDAPWTFLDNANLVFHEAGHFICLPFGEFMHFLGGSLFQLLVPFIIACAFIRQASWFSAAFAVFWLGESMANLSHYIADARNQLLPLLGGDSSTHDWNWILTQTNHLQSDLAIGQGVYVLGSILVGVGITWMIYATFKIATESAY